VRELVLPLYLLGTKMWQSQLTEYFQGRKRNSNFQPSKRQKVEVEPYNSEIGKLQVSNYSSTKKTNVGVVQTKPSASVTNSKKHNTGSRIPATQKYSKSHIVRLNDIWPKSGDATFSTDLTTDTGRTSVTQNNRNCYPASSKQQLKQHLNVTENRKSSISGDHSDVSVATTNAVSSDKLPASPSKRRVQYDKAEESDTNAVSDIATAVIDDHGNSHSCTPSKRRTVEPVVDAVVNNKRERCFIPNNSSNYYKTPQKFDFSPYQLNTPAKRSSARKKLVLPNVDVKKLPPVFVFTGSTKKSPESSVAIPVKEKRLAEVQERTKDVTEPADEVEHGKNNTRIAEDPTDDSVTSETGSEEVKTLTTNASSVKIGTCRNLEQLKKKLQDLSPHKTKVSSTGDCDESSSGSKRYASNLPYIVNNVVYSFHAFM